MLISLPVLDTEAMQQAAERQGQLIKPAGALGRLEGLSVWLSGVQGVCPPHPLRQVRVVIFAGDHGVARAGVSAYPMDVTAQMVKAFAEGGAACNVLARLVSAGVRVEDMAVGRPSGAIDREDAITEAQAREAFEVGQSVADAEVDAGADLLIAGDMGIGNTTVAATLVAALLDEDPVAVVGRGTGIDDDAWMVKVGVIRDALRRIRDSAAVNDPIRLLAVAGGADFAALTGFLVGAALRKTPVLLDGVVSTACALVADRAAPGISAWQVAATRSPEPAQALALAAMQQVPLLDVGMRLGEATGALLSVPLVQAAATTLAEMATFATAGVSEAIATAPPATE